MHGNTSAFTSRVQTGHGLFRCFFHRNDDLAVTIGRNAPHGVVGSRENRYRRLRRVDTDKRDAGLTYSRQAFLNNVFTEMIEFEHDMVLVRATAPALTDFGRDRTADNVTTGQILGFRRVPFHQAFAVGVD